MFAALMAVSAMSVPSSATSVSGTIKSGINASGTNSITLRGASARTYANTSMALSVQLEYQYNDFDANKLVTWTPSNGNNPTTSVNVYYNFTCDGRSVRCRSYHSATYTPPSGASGTWSARTDWEYYK